MTSPAIDASGCFQHLAFTNVSSCAVTTSTTSSAGVLFAFVSFEGATARTVSSVTASGLTFTKRKAVPNANSGVNNVALEVWTAPWSGGALSSLVVTANMSGLCDGVNMVTFGVTGCANNSSPFDPNVAVPNTATTASGAAKPTLSLTTSKPDDLVLFFMASSGSGPGNCANPPTSYTLPTNASGSGGGVNWCDFGFFWRSVSASQSGVSVTPIGAQTDGYVEMIDAVTADTLQETATGAMAFGPAAMVGVGTRVETATETLHFGPHAFSVSATDAHSGSGGLAFGPHKFVAAGGIGETASGGLAFGPAAIVASGLESPPAGKGKRQFWTFGA